METGDTLTIKTPNGGGYGLPIERDPERLFKDVLDGYITFEDAEKEYGVAIDLNTKTVEYKATENLRKGFTK